MILAANAASAAPDLAALNGMSAWKYVPLERSPGIMWRHYGAYDFQDTRFEYRWKSEWSVNAYVCTVEIRLADNTEASYTIPEINLSYSGPNRIGLHFRVYTVRDVAIGNTRAPAVLTQTDCERVDLVSWRK